MSLNNKVACPLDCFDACEAVYKDEKCKPNPDHFVTNGKLCVKFAHLLNEKNLISSKDEKNNVSLDESLNILKKKLDETEASKVLYYKGSGNLGVMQSSPKVFFDKYGATFTKGSLCDGGGGEGLEQGRGLVVNPPLENLLNADVVIAWGRNFSITSPHMYELVKDKTFITIDPIVTDMAKKSELHLQLNPKTDHELALLLTRFAYMDDMDDAESYEEYSSGADWFFDLAKSRPLVSYEATIGVHLSKVVKLIDMIKNKKIAIMVGLGVQKYYEGSQIIRAIDSFAAYIGVHNKNAGGLWYLADSSYGYENQFKVTPAKKVDITTVDFGSYDVVFIQGANPVVSSPNTQKVIDGLKNSYVVYFGTTYNDTCEYANLIIPSADFLTKRDVRLSYGHEYKAISDAVKLKDENCITEYELANFLLNSFGFDSLEPEEKILDYYINTKPDLPVSPSIESFEFIEELEIDALYEQKKQDEFYLITAKAKNNLNSQFKIDNCAYLHSSSGFKDGAEVVLSSLHGKAKFTVRLCEDIHKESVLIYAGAKQGNYITPYKSDESSFSAIYQEVLVSIELS